MANDRSSVFLPDQSQQSCTSTEYAIDTDDASTSTKNSRRLLTKLCSRPPPWLYSLVVLSATASGCHAFVPIPMTPCTNPTHVNHQIYAEHSLPQRTWRRRRQPTSGTGDSNTGDDFPQHQLRKDNNNNDRRMLPQKAKPMPITGYNADAILEFYDKRPLEVGWRLNSLGLPLLGWYLGLLGDQLFGIQDGEAVQRKRGVELREHLVRTKSVALIKV